MMKWVTAAAPGLGWDDDQLDKAYDEKMRDTAELAFEADHVAGTIRKFMSQQPKGWEGTANELLIEINKLVTDAERHAKTWPKSPSALSNRLERIAPLLRGQGLIIERRRAGGARIITIVRAERA